MIINEYNLFLFIKTTVRKRKLPYYFRNNKCFIISYLITSILHIFLTYNKNITR